MNILYISKLTGNMWAGLNHSVPAQVKSQSKIDNCFWYNINDVKLDDWEKDGLKCYNLVDYPSGRLSDLPEPFNKPDIAIIESCYCYTFDRIIRDLMRAKIPYIIVPRSSLTKNAQKMKPIKKYVGNHLFFNKFIGSATAIHYLSEQEKNDSIDQWGENCFVIPNGTHDVSRTKDFFNNDRIDIVYIGRVEIFQKGLDLLVEAVNGIQDQLRSANCHFSIYGPNRNSAYETLSEYIYHNKIEDLVSLSGPLFGIDKESRLLTSDVFIMTSRFEGMPMGLIEALSYGVPCLVTNGSNMRKIIEESNAGWGSNDCVKDLEFTLLKMIDESCLFEIKSQNAIDCSSDFKWDRIALLSHNQYESLLSKLD